MKIAFYSYDHVKNPWCGGGGAFRDLEIHRILAARHDIAFYCGAYWGCRNYRDNGVAFSFLGWSPSYLSSRISYSLLATIHSLFVKADLIVIGYSVFSPVISFLFRNRITIIELFHLTGSGPWRKYAVFGFFSVLAEWLALAGGRHFICINHALAQTIRSRYGKRMVETIATGFNEELLHETGGDKEYILYFGRIDVYMKGIDLLIDAFESIADSHERHGLVLAGRGSRHDTEWLRRRIERSPQRARISFHENVPDSLKADLYRHATLVCMPSRFEGWCIAAIEAAACAKPTIGARISGLEESIRDIETGLLITPESTDELAFAISRLLSDPELRARLGSNGPAWARNFTWGKIAAHQEAWYRKVVSG
ncbi:MAG: glycosyltransferase family 4 protein [Chitinispirillaceae bacterium]|nr:glycosyltransferase family 4 protein [Chitinispirillaceae bacterium]